MKIYLAGMQTAPANWELYRPKYVLESYAYMSKVDPERFAAYDHLLDSGAFTFLKKRDVSIDWKTYVEKYGKFIKEWKITKYFELDIYSIIGHKQTENLRDQLEQITGIRCIPVWHRELGKEYLHKLCEEFSYIGIGGFAIKDIGRAEFKYIPPLLAICKAAGVKVHGLGFTNQEALKTCKFYSVDSTSWNGGRFGSVFRFINGYIETTKRIKTHRVKWAMANEHNFAEWVKFQYWAEENL